LLLYPAHVDPDNRSREIYHQFLWDNRTIYASQEQRRLEFIVVKTTMLQVRQIHCQHIGFRIVFNHSPNSICSGKSNHVKLPPFPHFSQRGSHAQDATFS